MSDQPLRLHRLSLARQILIAIGLPAAVAAAAAAGCGGEAVVEPDEPGGGSATSSSSSSTSITTTSWTEGRPFSVAGSARVADACARDDWRDADQIPNVDGLSPATRQALASAWERDARFEHASVASFARFVLELLAVGAPPDLIRGAQQAIADEIRHAELCFGLASAYRGKDLGPAPLPIADALTDRASLADIAVATVHEGCINETLATLVAMAARDQAEDPAISSALAEIIADESKHAALAWRFVAWACDQDPTVGDAVADAFAQGLQAAPPTDQLDADADAQQLRAHGKLPTSEQAHIAGLGLRQVIEPCMRTMLTGNRQQAAQVLQTALQT